MGSSIQRLAGTLFGFGSCSLASQSFHLLEKTLFGTAAKTKQGLSISEANLITTRLGALPQCFFDYSGFQEKAFSAGNQSFRFTSFGAKRNRRREKSPNDNLPNLQWRTTQRILFRLEWLVLVCSVGGDLFCKCLLGDFSRRQFLMAPILCIKVIVSAS